MVLRATGLTGNKVALANEKFTKARDRASRWKFLVGDLIQGSSLSRTDKLTLRYPCSMVGVDVDTAGHVWLLPFAIQRPMKSYLSYSIP